MDVRRCVALRCVALRCVALRCVALLGQPEEGGARPKNEVELHHRSAADHRTGRYRCSAVASQQESTRMAGCNSTRCYLLWTVGAPTK